jgi:DNA-binding transcriptional ArsR family regulator
VELNAVGDLVLVDPDSMRALADPFRLALFDWLRRDGPATGVELAARSDTPRAEVRAHLDELQRVGFVTCDDPDGDGSRWRALGKGIVFEVPDDPDGQEAARQLTNVMLLSYVDLPRRWLDEDEPQLELDWVRAAGMFNARMTLTPAELHEVQAGLETLFEPYITREPADVPDGAASVRILSYFMPEARAD